MIPIMNKTIKKILILFIAGISIIIGCNREEEFKTEKLIIIEPEEIKGFVKYSDEIGMVSELVKKYAVPD